MTIRVLHVLPGLQHGDGMSTVFMNYLRTVDHDEFVFDVICHWPYDEDYKDEVERYGGNVTYYPKFNMSNIRESKKAVNNYFNSNASYDVVHCHMANAAFIYLKAARENGVPLRILHSHQDHYADSWTHAVRNYPLVAMGKHYANYYIACSEKAGDFLFRDKKYTILKNSIPTQQYRYDSVLRQQWREANSVENDIVFSNIGRLSLQKNQEFVLNVYSGIRNTLPSSKLFIAGDGELREELRQHARQLGIDEYVVWLGNTNHMNELYQGVDVLLFPSLYEGLPMTLIEAQAAGVSCLASDCISEEAMVTDFVKELPIDQGVALWIESSLNAVDRLAAVDRSAGAAAVRKAGFDIADTVHDLENIYRTNIYI